MVLTFDRGRAAGALDDNAIVLVVGGEFYFRSGAEGGGDLAGWRVWTPAQVHRPLISTTQSLSEWRESAGWKPADLSMSLRERLVEGR